MLFYFVVMIIFLVCQLIDIVYIIIGDIIDGGIVDIVVYYFFNICGNGICDFNEDIIDCVVDCEDMGMEIGGGNDFVDCFGCVGEVLDCQVSCQNKGFVGGFCIVFGSVNLDVCCMCSKFE